MQPEQRASASAGALSLSRARNLSNCSRVYSASWFRSPCSPRRVAGTSIVLGDGSPRKSSPTSRGFFLSGRECGFSRAPASTGALSGLTGTRGSTPVLTTIRWPFGFSQTSCPCSLLPIFSQPHWRARQTIPGKKALTGPRDSGVILNQPISGDCEVSHRKLHSIEASKR